MSENRDQARGAAEQALIEARRAKASRLRERGGNPFANDASQEERTWIGELRHRFRDALLDPPARLRYDPAVVARAEPQQLCVVGRIVARRGFGGASFLRLRDASDEIQLFAKQDVLGEGYRVLEEIDVADHIEARGRPMATKRGELSLELTSLRLLSKAYRPLPDKWHGLTDVDLRYRRRYVDLVANPEVAAVLRARTVIVQALREFLDERGFLEVETPTLHTLVGGAAARPFITHHNSLDLDLYLRIAPELYLKRLLVGGLEKVYEIGRCYRNEGLSTRHSPEFTALEFYQAYATYQTLMELAEQMLRQVDQCLEERMQSLGLQSPYAQWRAQRPFTFRHKFVRISLHDAVRAAVSRARLAHDLLTQLFDAAVASRAAGAAGARARDRYFTRVESYRTLSPRAAEIDWANLLAGLSVCDSDGERTFVAYEYLAEPFLGEDYRAPDGTRSVPVFITDYPAEVSPLARRSDLHPELTERFELFVHSRELCNAFSELNDPDDQAARFRDQVERKQRGQAETMDYDEDYIRALEHGMPPAAGFGLGIDRLAMMLTSQPAIRDVIAFPLLRPESGG
jgi:lysyl-tRNA synthetase class 2